MILKPGCGGKRSETNSKKKKKKKCREASEPLMLAGAETAAHATINRGRSISSE